MAWLAWQRGGMLVGECCITSTKTREKRTRRLGAGALGRRVDADGKVEALVDEIDEAILSHGLEHDRRMPRAECRHARAERDLRKNRSVGS